MISQLAYGGENGDSHREEIHVDQFNDEDVLWSYAAVYIIATTHDVTTAACLLWCTLFSIKSAMWPPGYHVEGTRVATIYY